MNVVFLSSVRAGSLEAHHPSIMRWRSGLVASSPSASALPARMAARSSSTLVCFSSGASAIAIASLSTAVLQNIDDARSGCAHHHRAGARCRSRLACVTSAPEGPHVLSRSRRRLLLRWRELGGAALPLVCAVVCIDGADTHARAVKPNRERGLAAATGGHASVEEADLEAEAPAEIRKNRAKFGACHGARAVFSLSVSRSLRKPRYLDLAGATHY